MRLRKRLKRLRLWGALYQQALRTAKQNDSLDESRVIPDRWLWTPIRMPIARGLCANGRRGQSLRVRRERRTPRRASPVCANDRALSTLRPRTPGQDAEAWVIPCYVPRHGFHAGFEIFVDGIDEQPLS